MGLMLPKEPDPQVPPREPMEAMDFGACSNWIFFVLFTPILGGLGVLGLVLAWDDLSGSFSATDAMGWCAAFAIYVLLLLIVFLYLSMAVRTRFTDEGLYRRGLFGTRFMPWSSVTEAAVALAKGNMEMVFRYDGRKRMHLVLNDFRRTRSLYEAMQARIPVRIHIAQHCLDVMKDR